MSATNSRPSNAKSLAIINFFWVQFKNRLSTFPKILWKSVRLREGGAVWGRGGPGRGRHTVSQQLVSMATDSNHPTRYWSVRISRLPLSRKAEMRLAQKLRLYTFTLPLHVNSGNEVILCSLPHLEDSIRAFCIYLPFIGFFSIQSFGNVFVRFNLEQVLPLVMCKMQSLLLFLGFRFKGFVFIRGKDLLGLIMSVQF